MQGPEMIGLFQDASNFIVGDHYNIILISSEYYFDNIQMIYIKAKQIIILEETYVGVFKKAVCVGYADNGTVHHTFIQMDETEKIFGLNYNGCTRFRRIER